MVRTRRQVNPSFDDPESFVLQIQKGVIHANIGDISNYLNASSPANAPLKNISIQPEGDQIKLHGTVHKIVPLPIELVGTLAPTPDGRVQFHVTKLNVLKVPLKGLLGGFHVELSDLVHASNIPGVQIVENDILFDTQKLLPPPHIHGALTSVLVRTPDIEVIYGNAGIDETQLAQWHNFLRLSGGTLDFGKLTMHHVDLTMIDASQDPWFDLDLVNYQAQLVNGYTRMTAQAGLEIFMPDLDELPPRKPVRASRSTGSKTATARYRLTFQSSSARFAIVQPVAYAVVSLRVMPIAAVAGWAAGSETLRPADCCVGLRRRSSTAAWRRCLRC